MILFADCFLFTVCSFVMGNVDIFNNESMILNSLSFQLQKKFANMYLVAIGGKSRKKTP